MSVRLFARSLPLVLAGALLAGPVLAQTTPPPAAPVATPAPAAPAAAPAKANPAVEKRIETLRTELKITPDQTKAFDEFAQVMRDNAVKMDALITGEKKTLATMTAVDHMQAYEAITQARADDMQREVPAFSRLYDALTPTQKKLADDSFRQAASGARRR
jgi:periplasmic protein CpxP/Spy